MFIGGSGSGSGGETALIRQMTCDHVIKGQMTLWLAVPNPKSPL